ncbi:hypothetical protein LJ656_32480 [Paraburkholderia sp. MMS20-SJTR3]|uniref:Uncharacterized protein n=1 Tax=Paraburkholderia sejongensis TaxID=2886946 RepID=A0ABS8K5B7_9BURK|nr:hypothetical protein [Paraburkholderia sp. MMS20-SJTR3]MCC8397293.1 hypothetical protein [Paraburkholderia sp. MMS20-SJTR3]
MTTAETIAYLEREPLEYALWWFIENMNEESEGRTEVFFFLRGRMRAEAPLNPRARSRS